MARVIVLDASVLIAYLDERDVHHAAAETLLDEAVDHEFRMNPLTLAEVLVGPARAGLLDRTLALLAELRVITAPFPADTAVRLASLRASTRLHLPDCCVLLAAETSAAAVATFDAKLADAVAARGLPVFGP